VNKLNHSRRVYGYNAGRQDFSALSDFDLAASDSGHGTFFREVEPGEFPVISSIRSNASKRRPRSRFEVPQSGTKTLPSFEFLSFKNSGMGEFCKAKFLRGICLIPLSLNNPPRFHLGN
jgi:hypothetical protein